MIKFAKTALASAFAVSMLAGTAFADENSPKIPNKDSSGMEMGSDATTTGSITPNMMSNDAIGAWQAGDYKIVQVSTLSDGAMKSQLEEKATADAAGVTELQSTIQANSALSARLQADNVQVNNIVAAEQGADGSVTFYVK